MVEIRRVRADEWREFRELRLEALKDSPLAFVEQYDESVAKPDDFWMDRTRRTAVDHDRAMFVAIAEGRFVGKASCFIDGDITDHVSAHIVGVYVTPPWRGRDNLSARLLGAAIGWAEGEARADRVRLFVTDGNDRAAAFYRRIGFVATGATLPYPPDPTVTEHEMVYRAA